MTEDYKTKLKAWEARRKLAKKLRKSGLTWQQVADQLSTQEEKISPQAARKLAMKEKAA